MEGVVLPIIFQTTWKKEHCCETFNFLSSTYPLYFTFCKLPLGLMDEHIAQAKTTYGFRTFLHEINHWPY